MRVWEAIALGSGALGALVWFAGQRSAALTRLAWRIPFRWRMALRGPAGDLLLVLFALLLHTPALAQTWRRLSPNGSPIGPDADENFLGAASFFHDLPSLWPENRFPGYPWAIAALSSNGEDLARMGCALSMAAAVGASVAAYGLGRQLAGRTAGLAGMVLCLRLPALSDLGRQTTPYMLSAALDLFLIAATVALVRGRLRWAVPVALAGGFAFTLESKQVPFVVAEIVLAAGVCAGWAVRRERRRRWGAIGATLALLAALPLANGLGGSGGRSMVSVEELITRVSIGLDVAPMTPGWTLGRPLHTLPASFLQIASSVHPPSGQGWLGLWAADTLPMEFPDTSTFWLLALAALAVSLRGCLAWLLPVIPLVVIAQPVLHLYFQHRYFVPVAVALPVLVACGLRLVAGPGATVGVLLAAVLLPSSSWRIAGPGLFSPAPRNAERWGPSDPGDWERLRAAAPAALPAGAHIYDFAASRPWTLLAGDFPYLRCARDSDACAGELATTSDPIVAILFTDEALTRRLPDTAALTRSLYPKTLGECWDRRLALGSGGAAYLWTCAEPPGG